MLDQLAQPVPSNRGSVMPTGMPKVVLAVLPMHMLDPAGILLFLVKGELVLAPLGTAIGVVDCADMFEMVSVTKEL
jgi:hypothetical protein